MSALLFAAFLFNPTPASAASRTSLASSIVDMLNQRLCDRQEALGGRVRLISPSKCVTTPPPEEDEPTVTLTADPETIAAGAAATLTWTSENATSCTAFLGWSGSKALNGSESVSPTTTTTYQLDCTGPGGVGSDDAVVTVTVEEPDAPTLQFTADPTTILSGATSTLSWASTNATTCTASDGWSGAKSLSGTLDVTPSATTTYTLMCSGAGGDVTKSVSVNVSPAPEEPDAPTVDLVAASTSVNENSAGNATTTLTWTTTNATSCTASGGTFTGTKDVNNSEVITPSATTTYTLECSGPGGNASDSVTVNFVPAPQVEGKLLITEVLYDLGTGQGTEPGNEWVELYNGTNSTINFSGWFIGDASTTDALPDVNLSAGAFAIVTGDAATSTSSFWSFPAGAVVIVLSNTTIGNGLGNDGDGVRLINTASTTVDAVNWGFEIGSFEPAVNPSPTADDFPGESVVRIDKTVDTDSAADWALDATPTPGEE